MDDDTKQAYASYYSGVYFGDEWLDGYKVIDTQWDKEGICKRCGKPFIKTKRRQTFCSRDCVSKYRNRMNKMEDLYGSDFTYWLKEVDYSYTPEKF